MIPLLVSYALGLATLTFATLTFAITTLVSAMAFISDSMQSQMWLNNFNPDAGINPHDVDQSGAGRFKEVGRFNPNASSVSGGIFAGEENQYMPRGNTAAIQRVKSRPTQGDFLSRLEAAEQRDEGSFQEQHYAGARPQPKRQMSPRSRAAAILNKQQAVMDKEADAQRQRQWQNVSKNGMLQSWHDGEGSGEMAAGGRSKTLQVQQRMYKQQQETMARAQADQDRTLTFQRQQQQQQEMRQQQVQRRQQQVMAQNASAHQHAMARQHAEDQQRAVVMHEQQQRQALQEQQFKTAWAQNRAKQRGSSGIQFG